jgi:hypothetical protein
VGECETQEPGKGEHHAHDRRIGCGVLVGHHADDRLQQRSGNLEGHGDQADLHEIERVRILQDWVGSRNQRLHQIVEEMGKPQNHKNCEVRPRLRRGRADGDGHICIRDRSDAVVERRGDVHEPYASEVVIE